MYSYNKPQLKYIFSLLDIQKLLLHTFIVSLRTVKIYKLFINGRLMIKTADI